MIDGKSLEIQGGVLMTCFHTSRSQSISLHRAQILTTGISTTTWHLMGPTALCSQVTRASFGLQQVRSSDLCINALLNRTLLENYIESIQELRIPILADPAGGNAAGASWFTLSLNPKNETRSTAQGFYNPQRPNLHLLTHNQVTKLQMNFNGSNPVVTGVEYSAAENEEKYYVSASEVILAAGTLHTPQILLLSGIGDAGHLSSLGIKTVVDLPGVGSNYHDHLLLVTVQSSR